VARWCSLVEEGSDKVHRLGRLRQLHHQLRAAGRALQGQPHLAPGLEQVRARPGVLQRPPPRGHTWSRGTGEDPHYADPLGARGQSVVRYAVPVTAGTTLDDVTVTAQLYYQAIPPSASTSPRRPSQVGSSWSPTQRRSESGPASRSRRAPLAAGLRRVAGASPLATAPFSTGEPAARRPFSVPARLRPGRLAPPRSRSCRRGGDPSAPRRARGSRRHRA
jgi:hypothetical protein